MMDIKERDDNQHTDPINMNIIKQPAADGENQPQGPYTLPSDL